MPGLVEGHAHISFGGVVNDSDLGNIPPEEHMLLTVRNAKTLLDHGFTSAYSAATSKLRLDVVIRNTVNAGEFPGPRIRAGSPEITVTGGLGPRCNRPDPSIFDKHIRWKRRSAATVPNPRVATS
jgi:imidazolonepropionase-like amidohydrolase